MLSFVDAYKSAFEETCKQNKLYYLLDDEIQFDGKNTFQFLDENSRHARKRHRVNFDHISMDIIRSTSYHIKVSVGNVFLYHKLGLFDFETNKGFHEGKPIYRYFPTFVDARFFYYANTAWQEFYNYWDRIGDLLWLCLELRHAIPEKKVYFGGVIKELENTCLASLHYRALKDFHDVEYEPIVNTIRREIVHYEQKDTVFFFDHINNPMDEIKMRQLQQRIEQIPTRLKRQHDLAIEGFGHAVRLIGEQTQEGVGSGLDGAP